MRTTTRSTPLVSCIMPTCNRRPFIPRAIGYFLRQDYAHKELIIVDDGTDPVGDLVPEDERIRYVRLGDKHTVGAKRNLACEQAHGDIIIHWDDDDWHAAHRVRYQLEALLSAQGEVCGLRQMLFYEPATGQTWLYSYPPGQRPWMAGGSLMYTRDFWRSAPFPNLQVGEDARFIWSHELRRPVYLPDYTFYVALIHPGNTSPKDRRGPYWSPYSQPIQTVIKDDLPEYPGLPPQRSSTGGHEMKINLGCCDAPLPGYLNVDMIGGPGIEEVDLRQPWPWPDDSADYVRAWDIVEHLPDKIMTMNELWRVLKPGGRAEVVVPTTDGTGAFQDPTHVSFWNRRSFLYYEPGNPYRERFAHLYGIRAKFRAVQERVDRTVDGPRLAIVLEAVKP